MPTNYEYYINKIFTKAVGSFHTDRCSSMYYTMVSTGDNGLTRYVRHSRRYVYEALRAMVVAGMDIAYRIVYLHTLCVDMADGLM